MEFYFKGVLFKANIYTQTVHNHAPVSEELTPKNYENI